MSGGRGLVRAVGAVALVAAGLRAARHPEPSSLDVTAQRLVARPLGHLADGVVATGTDLGSVFGLTGVSGVLAATGHRGVAAEVVASGSLAWVVAQGTKRLVDRRRPYELGTVERLVSIPAGSSWPSGHAAVAAAMATTLAPSLSPAGRAGAGSLAGAVAATRLYVGVHHVTDVVSGAAIGVLAADATRRLRAALGRAGR